jgi:hypothetical protein
MSTASDSEAQVADWGIQPNAEADAQFKSVLAEIREAELAAERDAANLRVC